MTEPEPIDPTELGDVLIALSVLAGRHGWTLDDLRSARWVEVRNR